MRSPSIRTVRFGRKTCCAESHTAPPRMTILLSAAAEWSANATTTKPARRTSVAMSRANLQGRLNGGLRFGLRSCEADFDHTVIIGEGAVPVMILRSGRTPRALQGVQSHPDAPVNGPHPNPFFGSFSQNRNLRPNCICRAALALKILPAVAGTLMVADGNP